MRKLITLLILLSLTVSMVAAQDYPGEEQCQTPATGPDTQSICVEYIHCSIDNYASQECYFNAFASLHNLCTAAELDNCDAFTAVNMLPLGAITSYTMPEVVEGAYAVAVAYGTGDAEAALESLSSAPIANFATALAEGTLYLVAGDLNNAESALQESIDKQSENPIAYFLHGQVLTEMDAPTIAARDFYYYNQFADEPIRGLYGEPDNIFTLPEDNRSVMFYPVLQISESPGGSYYLDGTQVSPTEVYVVDTVDGIALVAAQDSDLIFLTQFTNSTAEDAAKGYTLQIGIQEYLQPYGDDPGARLILSVVEREDGGYDFVREAISFESSSYVYQVAVPLDAPDPTADVYRPCEGLNMSFIREGAELVMRDQFSYEANLYSAVDYETLQFDNGVLMYQWWADNGMPPFVVTGPAECTESSAWWPVTVGDMSGYIADEYAIIPQEVVDLLKSDGGFIASELLRLASTE